MYSLMFFVKVLIYIFSPPSIACDKVGSLLDSGNGTLQEAIACNTNGAITSDSSIDDATIVLDSSIRIDRSFRLLGEALSNVNFELASEEPVFIIEAGDTLVIEHLTLLQGKNTSSHSILNRGVLILKDVTIKTNRTRGADACLLNEENRIIIIEGNTEFITRPLSGLIFETDFEINTGYSEQKLGLWNGGSNSITQPPYGWDGVKYTDNSPLGNF